MTRDVVLSRGPVTVRPLRRADERAWLALRQDNRAWLRPWEASTPPGRPLVSTGFPAYVRGERRRWREGRSYGAIIEYDGAMVGRITVHAIEWGAQCGGSIGYWISAAYAGRGIVPTAVAMLSEYAFGQGLHRLEIALRPENDASLRVVQKLGFRSEGVRERYLFIDGDWRDHQIFSLTADEPRNGPFWGPAF